MNCPDESVFSFPFSSIPGIFVGITKRTHYHLPSQHPGLTGKEPTQQGFNCFYIFLFFFLIASMSNHPNILVVFSPPPFPSPAQP